MRPVDRGAAPANATTYEEMRQQLLERLGRYCSYCEYPTTHSSHVEHIVPQKKFAAWCNRWDNLVLSCTYCNSRKGKTHPHPNNINKYLWPTKDNTFRAFCYASGIPRVHPDLPADTVRTQAAKLYGLVQLAIKDDDRHKTRAEVYNLACNYFQRLEQTPDPNLAREAIVDLAKARGFFSIWMTVFANDPDMKIRLINAFPGTATNCFDAQGNPLPRPGGAI